MNQESVYSYKYAAQTDAIDRPYRDRINSAKYRLFW
jgi:hypothetical protein